MALSGEYNLLGLQRIGVEKLPLVLSPDYPWPCGTTRLRRWVLSNHSGGRGVYPR